MVIGFVIWSIVSLIFLIIGYSSWTSKEEIGFFTGVKPPKMKDTTGIIMLWQKYGLYLQEF